MTITHHRSVQEGRVVHQTKRIFNHAHVTKGLTVILIYTRAMQQEHAHFGHFLSVGRIRTLYK